MFYAFPEGTRAVATADYERPYLDPICVQAGDAVKPDLGRSTDFLGWVWCVGPDGRQGWVPRGWIDETGEEWRMRRDFSALELTVTKGESVDAHFSESGFVFATARSGSGWLPDAVLELVAPSV